MAMLYRKWLGATPKSSREELRENFALETGGQKGDSKLPLQSMSEQEPSSQDEGAGEERKGASGQKVVFLPWRNRNSTATTKKRHSDHGSKTKGSGA